VAKEMIKVINGVDVVINGDAEHGFYLVSAEI